MEPIRSDRQHAVTYKVQGIELRAYEGDGPVPIRRPVLVSHFYRHNWGPRSGQWRLTLIWGNVTPESYVYVACSEGDADEVKHLGAARYTTHNIVPGDGSVAIWVDIEWPDPIPLLVDYMVCNNSAVFSFPSAVE
jgi:hypothetical protein